MTDANPISRTPHLLVVREANPDDGTNLYEFWQLQDNWWKTDHIGDDGPSVKCHVAYWQGSREERVDNLPPKDKRATDSSSWSETPEEVREQFRQEIQEMQEAMGRFAQSE